MKKAISLLLSFVLILSLAACGGYEAQSGETQSGETNSTEKEPESSAGVQVDEGLLNVDVTLAASFFEDQTAEEIKAEAKENGYSDCKINDDGSVTYTMSKKKHAEMLDEMKASFDELIAGCLEGEDEVASFVDIQYNDDFSKIDIYVDAEQYTMWDSLYALIFYITGAYCQAFAGVENDNIDVVVNFIDDATKEVLDTASYKEFVSNTSSEDSEEETSDEGVNTSSATLVAEQETISIADVCEFYVDYTDITDDVMPPQPGDWYSHYESENGKVYVDICVSYKNLSTKDRGADEIINATLIYGGKYQYNGFSMIEEGNRGDFTYSNITSIAPLSQEYLHYLFEVPAEMETSDGALTILLNVEGNPYSVVVREGVEGEVASINENAVAKTSGAVKDGEIIAVANNCEFFVDYSDITDDVMPPQPGDWYFHYEADDGKVYVDFCVGFKNWKTKDVGADDVMSATLTYAGKYEYTGFSMIEESSRGDFTYSNITRIAPLTTEYLHYLFEVPAEVETSGETIEIEFVIGGNTYFYKIR